MKSSLVIVVVLGILITQSHEVFAGWFWSSSSGGSSKLCFSNICSGNHRNEKRGCDSQGCGHYGASRRRRTHRGIDIVCSPASQVYAPFDVRVLRRSNPYIKKDVAYNTGIYLEGTGSWANYKVKMFYVKKKVNNGESVSAGSYIGDMTNMAATFPGMKNHVHVTLYKYDEIVDPTSYVC